MRKKRSFISLLAAAILSSLLLTLLSAGWGQLSSPALLHAQEVLPDGSRSVDVPVPLSYNVELIGQFGGEVRAVAVQGNYVYAGMDSRLVILDITHPATPTVAGDILLPDRALDIAIADSYVYIADWYEGGLQVVDVSNPAQPVEAGSYNSPGQAVDVTVAGSFAYLADGFEGLRVVDVSNPAQPVEVGTYETPDFASGVAVSGGFAYVADGYGRRLRVVDVSNPAQPIEVGSFDTSGYASNVVVVDGLAYVTVWSDGLRVVDVSDPTQPVEIGFYDMTSELGNVAVVGGFVYLAAWTGGLRVMDVGDPAQPVEVGSYATPGEARDVAVAGGLAYVADMSGGLLILRYQPTFYPVVGRVTNWDGLPLPGIELSITPTQTAVTDSRGNYTFSRLVPGIYTVTPTYADFIFEPASRTFSVPPLARGQDFAVSIESVSIYTIGGGIYESSFDGPLPFLDSVSLYLSNGSQTATSDGRYAFADLPPGSHVVTPSLAEHSFYPASRAVMIPPNREDVDFIVVKDPALNILGTVRQSNGEPFAGVQMQIGQMPTTTRGVTRGAALLSTELGISSTPSTTTDAEGRYAFLNLEPGAYTVAAHLDGYALLPVSRTVVLPTLNEYLFTILSGPVIGTATSGITTTLTLTDTQGLTTTLTFPADALPMGVPMPVTVTVTPGLMPFTPGYASIHHTFELTVTYPDARGALADFTQPVSVTVRYSITDTRVVSDTGVIGLWRLDAGEWVQADQNCSPSSAQSHDESARVVYSTLCQPGLYALAGPTHQRFVPWVNR